jgi:metal-responsive CopG/Arc/MetJ family transcriptional regulator
MGGFMGTELPRVVVTLTEELYEKLEDYRRKQPKIPSRSEAVRELLDKALQRELMK